MENFQYTALPPGHQIYPESEKDKCPVYQQLLAKNNGKTKKKEQGGGCPFLPKQQKMNPPLEHYEFGFTMKFYTQYSDILYNRKGFSQEEFNQKRVKVNTYPLYLLHTLFHNNDEQTKKIRQISDVGQKFFIQDEIREKGNKLFQKKQYLEAIDYYERALSLFKWLNLKELILGKEKSQTNVGKIINEQKKEDEKFYQNYKEYFSLIFDENTELQEMLHDENDHEKELRNSILMVLYQNLCACYMKIKCFDLALQSINDALELAEDHCSINFFKKSQVILYNKSSTIEELEQANFLIEKAKEIKKTEKLFKMSEMYLNRMNIKQPDQMYQQQQDKIKEQIQKKRDSLKEKIIKIAEKAREIQYINEVLGKDKNTNPNQIKDLKQEFKIINLMKKRALQKIEFYTQKQIQANTDY